MNKQISFSITIVVALILGVSGVSVAADSSLKGRAAAVIGYDDNTGLNANRKGDGFVQESASVIYRKKLPYALRGRVSGSLLNLNYFDTVGSNLLLPIAGAGIDVVLGPKTLLETSYDFTYVTFPNVDNLDSYENEGRVGLKQVIMKNMLLRGGFGVSQKDFVERKARLASAVSSASKERGDTKYIADSDLSIYLSKSTILKLGFVYNWNDSNDLFHDYYDYESYRLSIGLSTSLTRKISIFSRLTYESREYGSRPLIDNIREFENDDIYGATGGAFFNISKRLSLGAIYNYRQKNSNEPSEKYSGSIATLGLYYSL